MEHVAQEEAVSLLARHIDGDRRRLEQEPQQVKVDRRHGQRQHVPLGHRWRRNFNGAEVRQLRPQVVEQSRQPVVDECEVERRGAPLNRSDSTVSTLPSTSPSPDWR